MIKVPQDTPMCNTFRELVDQPVAVKLHLVQHHMALSRLLINELLEDEVRDYAGERYNHDKPHDGRYHRWGRNPGSVRVGDEKLRLEIPRLYDTITQAAVPLSRYQQLRYLPAVNDRLLTAVLLGLGTGDYQRVAQELVDSLASAGPVWVSGSSRPVPSGSKGLRKAVAHIFGDHCVVQRCQYHKCEHVVSYLNEADQATYRARLNRTYRLPDYQEARAALETIHADVARINQSAANSLQEGLDETLTLQRLGVVPQFHQTFATTNPIENVNMLIGKYVGKVKYWQSSEQRHRWLASALLEVEQRMRWINHYRDLDTFQAAVKKAVKQKQANKETNETIQAAA